MSSAASSRSRQGTAALGAAVVPSWLSALGLVLCVVLALLPFWVTKPYLLHMGVLPGPSGETQTPDLPMARQTIDTLEMLLEKTRGNLDADEQRLMESVLYEVRMNFVRAERGQ